MIEALFPSPRIASFLIASFILAIVPGPGVLYLGTQTVSHGRRAGFASVGGIALGNFGNAVAASLGLAAVLAASAKVFFVVKLAGAAYLVFLGIRSFQSKQAPEVSSSRSGCEAIPVFRDGLIVALLNPKTALFFAAFLPQFIDSTQRSAFGQSVALSILFVMIAMGTDSFYVLVASALTTGVRRRGSWTAIGRYASAATFLALGIYAALSNTRPAK